MVGEILFGLVDTAYFVVEGGAHRHSLEFHIVVTLGPGSLVHIDDLVACIKEVTRYVIEQVASIKLILVRELELDTAVGYDSDILVRKIVGQTGIIRN